MEENTGERDKLVMEKLLLLRIQNMGAAFPFLVVLEVQSLTRVQYTDGLIKLEMKRN